MKTENYACDGCAKLKGPVNHWYSVLFLKSGVLIMPFNEGPGEHFCGQECLIRAICKGLPQ